MFLYPAVQHYPWGCKGCSSLVAQIWKRAYSLTGIEEHVPYAELWYGVHPSGLNIVKCKNGETRSIAEFINNNEQFCSKSAEQDSDTVLPYLLKVLCSETALSIQCHPDKKTAERLFQDHPDVFKDANHKPEISLALSDNVESLCGFKPWVEIAEALNCVSDSSPF